MWAMISGMLAMMSGGGEAAPSVTCRIADRSPTKTAVPPRDLCAAFKQALRQAATARSWDIQLTLRRPGTLTAAGTFHENGARPRTLDPVSVAVSDAPIGRSDAVMLAQAVAASIKVAG